jgi:hypothetical protein
MLFNRHFRLKTLDNEGNLNFSEQIFKVNLVIFSTQINTVIMQPGYYEQKRLGPAFR